MAASISSKRSFEKETDEIPSKISSSDKDDKSLQAFVDWCKCSGISLNDKVKIGKEGSCAQYGMIAIQDIKEDECLFTIPRSKLLYEKTTAISHLLADGSKDLESKSGWVPLLLSLFYEYNNPQSAWRPYLDLVPDFKELNLPLFWDSTERQKLLKGTGVIEAVQRDEESIKTEFNQIILPFIQKHPDTFQPMCKDIDFYKKMVAFVMAYSFTVEKPDDTNYKSIATMVAAKSIPMMVPVADILNSVAKNNAQLEFEKDVLKMIATKDIAKGEEIFNSYDSPDNAHLLQMYGYAEKYPNNHNDTVEIAYKSILTLAKSFTPDNDNDLIQSKWEYFETMEIVDDEGGIVIGRDGILTDYECEKIFKVMMMSQPEFEEFVADEDEDSDDDEETNIFSLENIPSLPDTWKSVLKSICEEKLGTYPTTLKEDKHRLTEDLTTFPQHHRYSLFTSHGQKILLHNVIDSCNKG